ncbi:MAG: ATP-dependent helicase [Lachnospiraceae bacterium]|nr:ATP-dependent helicase [Lachnospiraceae bacterium]
MSLQFILGGAGTGKSFFLNRSLVEEAEKYPERQFFAIVPEQFTMETQKALVMGSLGHSILNIDIVSFERLAYRVFEELSCMPKIILDDMGKSMLLRKTCALVEKKLEVYKNHLNRAGFIEQLKSTMSEFGQYRIGEEELLRLTKETENRPLLHRKLKDIQLLFGAFQDAMGEGMITAEELLPSLCRVIPRSEKLRDSVIALDGFTGFTPAQYQVIRELLGVSRRLMVAVTIDGDGDIYKEGRKADFFTLSRKTIAALGKLAEEVKAGREEDVILREPVRFQESEELAFLSGRLFKGKGAMEGKTKDVFLSGEASPHEEVRALAVRLSALVREEGYRYREIAIVCGDMEGYRPLLVQAMEEAGLPAFLDDKRSLLTNPAVEYMRAALEAVEKDFSYESVFRYLKCGFLPFEEDLLFEMENYVLAMGIRGHKRWEAPWETIYRGGEHVNLELLNGAREQAAAPLLFLRKVFQKKGVTVREMTEALFHFLDGGGVGERLLEMADRFREEGAYSLAKEYEQAYGQLLDLFDRITGLLGDQSLSVKTYNDVLDAGCREIRVGVIPAALDRILVGDVERSRLKDIKALFFIGVNDGNVPKKKQSGGLLSELDREELAPYAELTPSRRESSLIDKFYFYLTVTKPSHKLYISYVLADEKGERKSLSPYLSYVMRLFPGLCAGTRIKGEKAVLTKALAFQMLAAGMEEYRSGEESGLWMALYGCLWENEEDRGLVEQLADAAFFSYDGDQISAAAARALYGAPLSGSVTRLETYAACAYAQFLTYGLKLVRRKEFEFAALDMGNVFHKAIELCFCYAAEAGIRISDLDGEGRKALVGRAMEEAAGTLGVHVLKSSARNEYLLERMGRITEKTLWALGEQLAAGEFAPTDFELNFAPGESAAMRILLTDGGTMQLKGKIDRVDLFEEADRVYVKIIDYKSGGKDFDLNAVYGGLELQLVVYLDAVMRKEQSKYPDKEIIPAGMFYYQIQDPILERKGEEGNSLDAVLESLRPKGVFNDEERVVSLFQKERQKDGKSRWIPAVMKGGEVVKAKSAGISRKQFTNLKNFVYRRMEEFGSAIERGEVSARPYRRKDKTGCDYCEFQSVCGFDRKLSGYEYRRLLEKPPEEIWEEIAGTDREAAGPVDGDVAGKGR